MKKNILLTILGLSTALFSVAQNGYEKISGGAMPDWFHYVLPTSDGNVIASGGTRSFGFGDINNYDGYVVKFDANGDTLWTRNFGTTGLDEGLSILENDKGYLVTGYVSSNGYDVYAVEYDANGNKLWENFYGGTAAENGLDAAPGKNKETVLCGLTTSYTNGGSDDYAVKIDSDGNQISDAHFGGVGNESAYGVVHTSDGGYAFIGYSNSTDPNYNIYLVKTDSDLDFQWSKEYGGIYEDVGLDAVEDASQNLWLLGFETVSPDSSYMVLIKTDMNGENAVTYHPATHGGDIGNNLRRTSDNGLLIAGTTSIFGKGGDMLLEKINSDGDTLWSRHFGGAKNEYGYDVASDAEGNIYVVGETEGFGAEQFDAYIVKLDSLGNAPCPAAVSFTQSANEICEDENVFFSNTTVSSQPFTWSVDGNEFSNDVDAGYYFSTAGNYSMELTACGVSSSQNVVVDAKPATHFTYTKSGDTVDFTLDPGIDVQTISWNFGDGSPLNTTDINPTHTYPAIGQFWVVVSVTNNAGCDSSYIEQIDLSTGIGEVAADGIEIYPNPASDKIFIGNSASSLLKKISILNVTGQVEKVVTPDKKINEISVHELLPGIYFLKLETTENKLGLYRIEVY